MTIIFQQGVNQMTPAQQTILRSVGGAKASPRRKRASATGSRTKRRKASGSSKKRSGSSKLKRLVKGSAAAKRYMAKIRKMRGK